MTKAEIDTFIEHSEEIGDVWDTADVERVYGNRTLEDALDDRMNDMMALPISSGPL